MNISWKISTFVTIIISALVLETLCRPSDDASLRIKRQAVEEKQFIGGLSTLGALIQPLLFMIGVANFMGRIPMFFNRMRDRFSSTLSGTGAPAGAGRKRRSALDLDEIIDEKSGHVLGMLQEAENKYALES